MWGSRRLSHLLADLLMPFSIIVLFELGQNLRARTHTHTHTHTQSSEQTRDGLVWWWTQTVAGWALLYLYSVSVASHHLERCAWTVLAAVIAAPLLSPQRNLTAADSRLVSTYCVYLLLSPEAGIARHSFGSPLR